MSHTHISQVHLFDRKTLVHTFQVTDTLQDVNRHIAASRTDTGAPYIGGTICVPAPMG